MANPNKGGSGADTKAVETEIDENKLIAERRAKLKNIREEGKAYTNSFRRDQFCQDVQDEYTDKTKPELEEMAVPVNCLL